MTSDADLINARRSHDERAFLANSRDPAKAPILAPAMNGICALLADDRWHPHEAVIASGLRGSEAAVKTVDGMLRRAIVAGFVEKRGGYSRTRAKGRWHISDSRQYRIIEWPLTS